MLAPPRDPAVAELAHRQPAPLDHDVVVAAPRADRPVGEHDAGRRPRRRGGARRTRPARPSAKPARTSLRYRVLADDCDPSAARSRMSSCQQSMYASRSAASHASTRRMKSVRSAAGSDAARTRSARALHEPVDERAQAVAHVGVELGRAGQRFGRLRRVRARDGHRRVDHVGLRDRARPRASTCGHSSLRPSRARSSSERRERVDHGQRVDAFVHVVAGRLAELGLGAR